MLSFRESVRGLCFMHWMSHLRGMFLYFFQKKKIEKVKNKSTDFQSIPEVLRCQLSLRVTAVV